MSLRGSRGAAISYSLCCHLFVSVNLIILSLSLIPCPMTTYPSRWICYSPHSTFLTYLLRLLCSIWAVIWLLSSWTTAILIAFCTLLLSVLSKRVLIIQHVLFHVEIIRSASKRYKTISFEGIRATTTTLWWIWVSQRIALSETFLMLEYRVNVGVHTIGFQKMTVMGIEIVSWKKRSRVQTR